MNEETIKIIAMYLPQFYETEDNNKWWGEGFTDWISAQNAKTLFEGHYQPHVPLNDYYYNLLDKQTMVEQQRVMNKYGVDGMCFYHYWFKDGRQTLEKPAENLLAWTDIDMPFCFSWANESWTRTWSNLDVKNVWMPTGESREEMKKNPSGILLEQDYGSESEWIKHYRYLAAFFLDDRYIKIKNRPVFIIYKPDSIPCFMQMRATWNMLAREDGFDGVYFIASNSLNAEGYDKILIHEPQYSVREISSCQYSSGKNVRSYYQYEDIWNRIISRDIDQDGIIYGGFVGYDDTPRRGRGGTVIDGATPVAFKKYMCQLLKKNEIQGNKIVFINAWNEWGEGMHLEPDGKYKYAYLEAIKEARFEYRDVRLEPKQSSATNTSMMTDKIKRYESYWRVLHQWLNLKEKGIKVGDYLLSRGYKKIGIYGMGMLGKHLIEELKDSGVDLVCGIDKNAESMYLPITLVTPERACYSKVDLIIVTVVYDYEKVKSEVSVYTDKQIVSILDVLKDADR